MDGGSVVWFDEWEGGEVGEEGSLDEDILVAERNHVQMFILLLIGMKLECLAIWYDLINSCLSQ